MIDRRMRRAQRTASIAMQNLEVVAIDAVRLRLTAYQ
jgi:hypothetical protein